MRDHVARMRKLFLIDGQHHRGAYVAGAAGVTLSLVFPLLWRHYDAIGTLGALAFNGTGALFFLAMLPAIWSWREGRPALPLAFVVGCSAMAVVYVLFGGPLFKFIAPKD